MSKNTIIGLVLLLIVLVSGGLYFLRQDTAQEKSLSTNDVQNILLYAESGVVSFKIAGTQAFQKATSSPTIIPNQTVVRTDIGRASVLLPNNSNISLDENTEITISYTEKQTSIYQALGMTYHRVETLLSGATYQVQTPGTLAAVRGTKFAVKYDTKTKKTKVAVTENKVQVSTIPKIIGTTTLPVEESLVVEAGKTVSVETVLVISPEKPSAMKIVDTDKDEEMRVWVDTNKDEDIKLNNLKKEIKEEKEFRKEMKRVLFDDITSEDTQKEAIPANGSKIEETKIIENTTQKNEETVNPKIEESQIKTSPVSGTINETVTSPIVKKLGEEEFFNAFSDMFIKYFYVDDKDTTCMLKTTPEERVRLVTSFATASGYPFTSKTLLSFAQAIDAYCSQKDNQVKAKLQGRFDVEFPYNE